MSTPKSERFNFLLTREQKEWLAAKSVNFKSSGDIVRSLIQEAMDKDANNAKGA